MKFFKIISTVVFSLSLVACQSMRNTSDRNPAQDSQGNGEVGSVASNKINCTAINSSDGSSEPFSFYNIAVIDKENAIQSKRLASGEKIILTQRSLLEKRSALAVEINGITVGTPYLDLSKETLSLTYAQKSESLNKSVICGFTN